MKSKSSAMLRKNSILLFLFALASTFNLFAQTADVVQGCAPLTVKFTNKPGVANPSWNLKDGNPNSTIANPTTSYTQPGIYEVELRDGNANSPIVGTVKITVFAKPILSVAISPSSGCMPLEVAFTPTVQKDNAIVINTYTWDFGDGNKQNEKTPNAKHTYKIAKNYSVIFDIKTNFVSCDASNTFKDTVKVALSPFVQFTTTPKIPTSCTAPFTVNFINASDKDGVSYVWNYGNGQTSTLFEGKEQTYSEGTYNVSLVGTGANGCKATVKTTVTVGKPRAAFAFSNDTLCLNTEYTPKNLSAFGNYIWNFGAGAEFKDPTLSEPSVRWTTPGLKTVRLKVTESSGGCQNDTTATLFIEDITTPVNASFAFDCKNPIKVSYETTKPFKSYNWSFSTLDKFKSTLAKPVVDWRNTDPSGYTQIGAFLADVTLNLVSYAGCEMVARRTDTFYFPNARVVPNKWQGCAPLTVEFADSSYTNPKDPISSYTYLWGDGSAPESFSTKATRSHTFNKAGEYKVRLVITNSKGCIDTSHVVLIEVGEPIAADFIADKTSICLGDTVKFTTLTQNPNIDAWHYSTDGDRSFHCYGDPNPSWTYGSVGKQAVSLTVGYNGCFQTVTKNDYITVKGALSKIDYTVPCAPDNLNVNFKSLSIDATSLTWDFGDGNNSTSSSLTHTYKNTGDYKVKLTASNSGSGCPASVDSAIVSIRNLKATFEIVKEATGTTAGFNLCLADKYKLKAKRSSDVNTTCYSGYTWYFSDPNERPITTTDSTIQFIPKIPLDYKIILAVRDVNGCVDSIESNHKVFGVYPKVTATPKEICIQGNVVFNGDSTKADAMITEWEWKFGDGKESKIEKNITHRYIQNPANNFFIATLNLKDEFGCTGSWSDTIKVYKPISKFTISKNPICLGDTVTINASDFTEKGNNLTYDWTINGVSKGTKQTIKEQLLKEGDNLIKLNFKETNTNCTGEISEIIEVQTKPIVDFEVPASVCAGLVTIFKDTVITKYPIGGTSWDYGNGSPGNANNINYDKAGTYKVTFFASTSAGCESSITKDVTVKETPSGDFTLSKSAICLGEPVTFTLKDTSKVGSFEWRPGDGKNNVGQSPYTHNYENVAATTTSYMPQLSLKAIGGGCEVVKTAQLIINRVDADFAILNNGACALDTIKFVITGNATTYSWNFGDNSPAIVATGKDTTLHKYNNNQNSSYNVTLTATRNGCTNIITKAVTVVLPSIAGSAKFPSIFAPESDIVQNKTYTFVPTKIDSSKCELANDIKSFEIFDRWGHKVYSSGEITNNASPPSWNGGDYPADVYMAIFYFKDEAIKPFVTDVTLIR
jgi:PKD repeat protein